MITAAAAPAATSASAARSGSSSPVSNDASSAVARTSSASGTHALAAVAASAGERHRCKRRFGSKITGFDADNASERAVIVTSRSSAPTSVFEPMNSAAEPATACSSRSLSAWTTVAIVSP